MEARRRLHDQHADILAEHVAVYDPEHFNPGLDIRRNLIMGRNNRQRVNGEQRVNELIREELVAMGLYKELVIAGWRIEVGIGGQRLAVAARQSLALARAILKSPSILICNDALNAHDRETRDRIWQKLTSLLPQTTFVWLDSEMPKAEGFDRVLVLRDGRLAERVAVFEPAEPAPAPLSEDEGETPQAIRAEAAALAKVPLFSKMRSNDLKFLALGSNRVTFHPGEVLLQQGELGETAFVVLSGEVDVLLKMGQSNETQLARLGRHELIGETSLLATRPRTASARAFTEVEALEIDKAVFLQIVRSDSNVAAYAARIAAERLADVLENMERAA